MIFKRSINLQAVLLAAYLVSAMAHAEDPDTQRKVWSIVNYWSEWCSPCRKEIPMLNALSEELDPEKARVVGVNFDEDPRQETLRVAEVMGIEFPTLTQAEVVAMGLPMPDVMPTTYIVTPDKEVAATLVGLQSREQVWQALTHLGLASRPPSVVELPSPAPANSHLSRLVAGPGGKIYLSWVKGQESNARLEYAQLTGEAWSNTETISEGSDWFVNWADFPVLSVSPEGMVSTWLRRSGADTYDYDIAASFFNPQQGRWSEAKTVNTSDVKAEHGFVSMTPIGSQSTLITWLDGRNTKRSPSPGPMTLRAAMYDVTGDALKEWELDDSVCDCCQTSSAMAAAGPVVVYRDRSEENVRDIAIVRFEDGVWSEPQVVHDDGWQVNGCPVNGPAVAAKNGVLAVAWFTAKDSEPKVQLALSEDGGEIFSSPILVAGGNTNGRVDTTILDNSELVVSWLDDEGSASKIMLSRYDSNGVFLDATAVATTSPSRRSGFPVIESVGDVVYVTWTDVSDEPRVRVAKVLF